MLKHYVEYLYPGLLVCETSETEVKDRKPENVKDPGNNTFAFRFFDREEIKTESGEILKGKKKNWSGTYYFGGIVYTAEEAKLAFPKEHILLSNIKCSNMKRIIKTKLGNIQEFTDIDTLICPPSINKTLKKKTKVSKKTLK